MNICKKFRQRNFFFFMGKKHHLRPYKVSRKTILRRRGMYVIPTYPHRAGQGAVGGEEKQIPNAELCQKCLICYRTDRFLHAVQHFLEKKIPTLALPADAPHQYYQNTELHSSVWFGRPCSFWQIVRHIFRSLRGFQNSTHSCIGEGREKRLQLSVDTPFF